jgi:branched-chain amino acid transport system ATP-binding protein
MLKVESLSVSYGSIQVVWDISFDVEVKSITAILGSNGAGKSTILETLAGLLEPKSGNIIFGGKKINRLAPYERVEAGLSLVPEGRRLFPYLTLHDNLRLGAYIKRAKINAHATLEEMYQWFPILKVRGKQSAGTLSGGEQQMAAIARGLMSRPKLLMLDEPSLGLDPLTTRQLFKLIKDINDTGVTILIVEQNIHHTLKIADKIFVLETGHMVAQGSAEELSKEEHIKKAYLAL